MMRFTNGFGVTKSAVIAPIAVLTICLSLSALPSDGTSAQEFDLLTPNQLEALKNNYPSSADVPCAAEYQLMLQAYAQLETAKKNAQDAYTVWFNCVNGGNPSPEPDPNPPGALAGKSSTTTTVSILERSN